MKKINLLPRIIIAALLLPAAACHTPSDDAPGTVTEPQTPPADTTAVPVYEGYTFAWGDEFNAATLDPANWTAIIDGAGGGNAELQYYLPRNVTLGAEPASGRHCLILTARRETYAGRPATSGRVEGRGKRSFRYGRLEASIKLPHTANGLWPAFWLLGDNYPSAGWPACGEIDVVEMGQAEGIRRGTQTRYYNGACHFPGGSAAQHHTHPASLQDDFHLFTLLWDTRSIRLFVDLDRDPAAPPYFTLDISDRGAAATAPFHRPFYLLFNLAVGGHFPLDGSSAALQNTIGNVTALAAADAHLYVDFVRLYRQ
jgi:beta-glucanase (GH16 family)